MKLFHAVSFSLALAVGALTAASPALAAEPTWQDPPVELSTSAADTWSSSPRVTPGPNGVLLAVWEDSGPDVSHLRSALWAEGVWGASATVSSGAGSDIGDWDVVSRSDGSFVVVWIENVQDMNVMTNTFAGGSWSTPTTLRVGPIDGEFGDLGLASAPNATVIVAWELDVGDRTVETVILGASGWGSIQDLGKGNSPAVAASPTGVFAITWRHETTSDGDFPAAKTFTGSTWSDIVLLSDESGGWAPELGASPTGFVAFWMNDSRLPFASTFTGTSWSSKVAMRDENEIGGGLTSPGLVVATPDVTAVTWSDGESSSVIIWKRTFNGTTWSAPVKLLDATEVGLDHQVVGTPDGTFMIVWEKNGGGPLMARTFTATTVGAPFVLSAASNSPSGHRLAAASNGYFVVTWQQGGSVFAHMFDGASWGASAVDLGKDSSQHVAATTDNVFVVAWETYGTDRGLIRATGNATPNGPTNSDGEELAATGAASVAGIGAVGAAIAVLMGALVLAGVRRRTAQNIR
jgi:hypothetical protein